MIDYVRDYAKSVIRAIDHDIPAVVDGMGRSRRPYDSDVEITSFVQSWPNTLGGHDGKSGLAGQAFTSQLTVVVDSGEHVAVYFGGRLAYSTAAWDGTEKAGKIRTLLISKFMDARFMPGQREFNSLVAKMDDG